MAGYVWTVVMRSFCQAVLVRGTTNLVTQWATQALIESHSVPASFYSSYVCVRESKEEGVWVDVDEREVREEKQ